MTMDRYTGTKSLSAKAMTLGEYNEYRGWTIPAGEDPEAKGYLVEYEDGGKANDSRHAGYISWSPAGVFERTYFSNAATPAPASDTFIQPKITGYRQLSVEEAALMNEAKALAVQCGQLIAKLRKHEDSKGGSRSGDQLHLDQRWISIGSTDLQTGFMAVIRGIAQPTTF